MKFPSLPLAAPVLAVAALLLAACDGPDRKAMVYEARHSIPPMAGDEPFFDGQVVVHLSLVGNARDGRMPGERIKGSANQMTNLANNGEGRFGDSGMGGGSSMGGEMGEKPARNTHATKGGVYLGNEGMGGVYEVNEDESPAARRRRDAEMPPALIRLRLENTSPATVIVEIRDFNSDLGNFAVRPDTITLNPGQTVETEPMQSLLGVDTFTLPVTVTLRAGGQIQSKTVTLRLVKPAADTPPPPPQR